MKSDDKISGMNKTDYRNITEKDACREEFPVVLNRDYRVFISETAYSEMKEHSATTDEVELCGVLVGDICRDKDDYFLKINAVIKGDGANNYGAQVTFTHETWNHINETMDKEYQNQKIVGWYHTHPGFGVFLSKMDSFIQDNFFNQPYQVAIVIETKQKTEGCFSWEDGKSVPMKRYWVGDREVTLAQGDADEFDGDVELNTVSVRQQKGNVPVAPAPGPAYSSVMGILIFALAFMLGQFMGGRNSRDAARNAMESEMYSLLEYVSLNAIASEDLQQVNKRISEIKDGIGDTGKEKTVEDIENLEIYVTSLEKRYGKTRSKYRDDLQKYLSHKKNLGKRLDDQLERQDEMKALLVQLYLLRIYDVAGNERPIRPDKMNDNDRQMLKNNVDLVLQISPGYKTVIGQMFPGLIEFYYPIENDEKKRSNKE